MEQLLAQAVELQKTGRLREALSVYQAILREHPNHPVALHLSGLLAMELGKADISENMLQRALKALPDYPEARYNYGNLLYQQERFGEAETQYRLVLKTQPDNVAAHNNLANALKRQGKEQEAMAHYRRTVELSPDFAEAWENLGKAAEVLGQLDDAQAYFSKALSLNPALAESHWHLSNLAVQKKEDDAHVRQMETLLTSGEIMLPLEKARLHFALAKTYDDRGEYDRAFGHYRLGNKIRREGYTYNIAKELEEFASIRNAFAHAPHHKQDKNNTDITPVFILGMPRSGTTLVEQILSSHPKVHGGGELKYLVDAATHGEMLKGKPFPAYVPEMNEKDCRALGDRYLASLRQNVDADKAFITDKMPHNFKYIGFIALTLPQARIIHCQRQPMDTCLSIFRQNFTSDHPYAYDLKEIGEYHRMYQDYMTFWEKMLPGSIHTVQYETLVDNLEAETRRMLDHCGLDWDDRCLRFHDNSRSVYTASNVQVRQPLYRSSIGAWRHYASYLDVLKKALAEDTIPLPDSESAA